MAFLPPVPDDHDEFRLFQQSQMLGRCLARDADAFTQFIERQAAFLAKAVQQGSAGGIRKRFENQIQGKQIMQPYDCMSRFLPDRTRQYPQ